MLELKDALHLRSDLKSTLIEMKIPANSGNELDPRVPRRNRVHLSIEHVHLGRIVVHDLEAPDAHAQGPLAKQGKTDLWKNKGCVDKDREMCECRQLWT